MVQRAKRLWLHPARWRRQGRAGLATLAEGQKIQFEIARDRGKESAANLSLIA
jgi:cold shock CspA family protein